MTERLNKLRGNDCCNLLSLLAVEVDFLIEQKRERLMYLLYVEVD